VPTVTDNPRSEAPMNPRRTAFEVGVVLPNSGAHASPAAIVRIAKAAEELGFDHVWVGETMLVPEEFGGNDTPTLDPLACLAYLAGRLERVRLGTTIVRLPLHHPVELAKQTASLQELSGGRLLLGVGVGWSQPEFHLLGQRFEDRERRTDEALRLLRAIWAGERDFRGEFWSLDNVGFAPLPQPAPQVWVGGLSRRSIERARELGDAWHPNSGDVKYLRRAKELWPEGHVVPRAGLSYEAGDSPSLAGPPEEIARRIEAYRTEGAAGLVITFGTEPAATVAAMERFAHEVAPRVGLLS
jgi:probable F420-dependent oxidoreductase